jgi:two-component system chemotaxis response regulator CheB
MKDRVIIVDDSAIYRLLVKRALSTFPNIEILYEASDGKEALAKIKELKPDFLISDVEMPIMNGLELLENIKKEKICIGVIMLSGASKHNANITIESLNLGAFDFIEKPTTGNSNSNFDYIGKQIYQKILLYKSINRNKSWCKDNKISNKNISTPITNKATIIKSNTKLPTHYDLILLGISTGGPKTLIKIFSEIKKPLPIPLLIVQHMPPMFTKSLADNLDRKSVMTVLEASNGDIVKPYTAYIAPGGKHLEVELLGNSYKLIITDKPPVNSCKPSVDVLFKSAKDIIQKKKVLLMILTGMGKDGKDGVASVKNNNTTVIAQDEISSIIYGMPRAIVDANLHDSKMSLDEIINFLNSLW